MKELIVNEKIREKEVRLIGDDGNQYGIVPINQAMDIAYEKGLDLVQVTPINVKPATCKLMDYGKYRYDQMKREKDAKKSQKTTELKTLQLSPNTDVGDINRLVKQALKFIAEGNVVKVGVFLRGRQQAHPEIAYGVLEDFAEKVKEEVDIDKPIQREGRRISIVFKPKAKTNKK